ncbi:MAG: M48 family metallopeptidase [Trueperaceae bacterium]|nr:M48 family metallopeptidase [Trueperaceae bacterium]
MTTAPADRPRLPDAITDPLSGRRISLLDWQAANRRASWLLAGFMVLLLGSIGYLVALAFDPGAAWTFIVIAAVLAIGQSLAAYWFSDRLALAVSGARPANKDEHRYLVNVTEAVAIGAGVPMPKIYVIDNPAPNAFATGRDPRHGAIAVTTGLMSLLDRQELEGVVAHEMAHVKNYDIRFASMLAATVGAIVLLRDVILRGLRFGGRSRRSSSSGGGRGQAIAMVLLIVLLILAPILATLVRLAVSRRREYLADATGAYITRNPDGLASALAKLRDYRGTPMQVSEGVQHMYFTNPVAKLNALSWLATHPPIDDRISRLRRM